MKTTNNNRNASRMATVICAAIVLGTCAWAQSDAGSNNAGIDDAYARLENLMVRTEVAIQYVAPSVSDDEVFEAIERMELLAQETEKSLRYEAPEIVTADLDEAVKRLELLASKTENEIKYRVSVEEPVNIVDGENTNENEIRFAQAFRTSYARKTVKK
jgi:hypothetical protein